MQQSVKNVCSISTAMTSGRCVCHCRAADGAAYAAAKQAVEVEPLNAAAHHALGLAAEARGALGEAAAALRAATSLLAAKGGASRVKMQACQIRHAAKCLISSYKGGRDVGTCRQGMLILSDISRS